MLSFGVSTTIFFLPFDEAKVKTDMEKAESSGDEERAKKCPKLQLFSYLVDREMQRLQLLEERESRSSGNPLASNTIEWKPWQPTFELEDFEMTSEKKTLRKRDTETKHESLLSGTKRTGEATPAMSTATEKKHRSIATKEDAFDMNKFD